MYVVGLTGGIGSGKSTVAGEFRKLGIEVIDADQIAREVVEVGSPALKAVATRFGMKILDGSGSLDRKALRQIVFADSEQRQWLEALLHPLIAERITARIADCAMGTSAYCILESPLLVETSQSKLVQRILVVDVDEASQLQRTLARDGSSPQTIKGIIASQLPREERLEAADDILDNNLELNSLTNRVNVLHQHYLELATDHDPEHPKNS
ncbi:MAG: dephospho-CoA kinase [Gammaproteobacteria bacterium]|nr:dephospho-CoA kinase [Gammaproteobacteria bacterium]